MYLTVTCPRCAASYQIAPLAQLPQTNKLMSTLADLHHGHFCSLKETIDERRLRV